MTHTPDWQRIGALISNGLHISRGDKVSIFVTDGAATDAVTALVAECWRRGAIPQVVATDERFDAAALAWAEVDVLSQAPPLEVLAMTWCDVHVSFRAMTAPEVDADPARIAALRRGRGLVSALRWEQTRWALVRVPTPAWAEAAGVDADALLREWATSFEADWADVKRRQSALCARLDATERLVIEDRHGRLELPVGGRSWVPFAGEANWPDGEIATAPIEDGVSGDIFFPGVFWFAGVRVRDLTLVFDRGLVVEERALEGIEFVRQLLDTDEGARRVGELGIGTNAALRTMTGDLLIDEKILGTVHIALGRAYPECGGVNSSALHWDIVKDLRSPEARGSLFADGEWLIKDGIVAAPLAEASVFLATPAP